MKKKLLCLLLAMTFLFNSIPVHASDLEYGGEVEELFLPALSVPVAQGFAYLMGTLGVLATSKVVYDNSDALQQWGEKEMEKFKLKCTALGIAGDLVENWLSKLATGVLDKSGQVWSSFKEWINELRTTNPVIGGIPVDGVLKANSTYNLFDFMPGLEKYYKVFEVTTSGYDWFMFAYRPSKNSSTRYICFGTTNLGTSSTNKLYYKRQTISGSLGNNSLNQYNHYIVDGQYYTVYAWGTVTDGNSLVHIPFCSVSSDAQEALKEYLSGKYTIGEKLEVESEYKLVGGVSDVGTSDIINVGNVSYPLGKDEVYIDFGNVATGSIAGALGGVHDGTLSWSEVIGSTGVNVAEGDKVVGDEGVTDVPVPDLGQLDDYKLDLTNLFPFCLPFDLIDFLNVLSAPAETPRFKYEMPLPAGKSYTFDIDLSPFDSVASLMRTMETLAFIIGLIFITREKMIRG